MQKEELAAIEFHDGAVLTTAGRDRLVELLAVGLERFLRAGGAEPDPLTSAADLCLYDDRADDAEADSA
jgi:hypothetical protein